MTAPFVDRMLVTGVNCDCWCVCSSLTLLGIQHNQCPCRSFTPPRRDTSSVATKLDHRDTTLPRTRYAVSTAVGSATPCHHSEYDRHNIRIIQNRETNGNKENEQKQRRQPARKKIKRKKEKLRNTLSCPPPQAMWQPLFEKNGLGKKEKKKTLLLVNRVRQGIKGKHRWQNNRQIKAQSTLQVAAGVCGTSSIVRSSPLVRLLPCYPDCRLRPAFVNCVQPLGVRQYATRRAGSSSTYATRLLQYSTAPLVTK